MKKKNHISQLTLELYYRGLATFSERRQVEKALKTDSEVLKRYEALQQSDREIRQLVRKELNRLNVPETPPIQFPNRRKVLAFIAAAAVLVCALIPSIIYFKNSASNQGSIIAEETTETKIPDETTIIEEIPNTEIATPTEPPAVRERGSSNNRTDERPVIAETPRTEPQRPAEPGIAIEPNSGLQIAKAPIPDNGVRFRGEGQSSETPTAQEQPSNINIPPGISFIFENMFANRDLTFVIIPTRITSIGKNAFSGNPILSVTIGADVSIEDTAIPGNFAAFYNATGKAAGTYTRPDVNSEAWEKN